jgi:hypothetical protein
MRVSQTGDRMTIAGLDELRRNDTPAPAVSQHIGEGRDA